MQDLPSNWRNVVLLAVCQGLAVSVTAMVIFVASLIGYDLASNPSFATFPNAAVVIGTALLVVPITMTMQRFGRRKVIFFAMLLAALSMLLVIYALSVASFTLFCVAITGLGLSIASIAQFRFWAIESVAFKHKSTAAAVVLFGGIVAAFLGPEVAVRGEHLLSMRFQGSFAIAAVLLFATGCLALLIKDIPLSHNDQCQTQRPFSQMLASPWLWTAALAAIVGYAVMTMVMTATPISMNHHYGLSLDDTKWVIQSHSAAMFLPSLFTPLVVRWLGLQKMIVAGALLYALCIAIGFSDWSLHGFWLSLVLLGMGWNLLYIAGTAMLPQTYQPNERFRAQAFNDGSVYIAQALASLSSGVLLNWLGWQSLLILCLPLTVIPVIVLIMARRKMALPAAAGV